MACIFRARVNQLWSIWYTVSMLLLQAYLLYLGFERYRLYSEMKWPHGTYPRLWLTTYIMLYSLCIPALLTFMAFGIFKSGNIAGDNDHLGARTERVFEIRRKANRPFKGGCSPLHGVRSLWQHAPPLPQLIHLLMALMMLFAQQIMLAQLYRYGFISSGDFLNTELDFVYQRARQLANNLPMLENRLQGFRISAQDLSAAPVGPNLLPVLMHARLFGIPLEFVNLLFALFAYSCAYSSVFWRVNKPYSFIFSIHLLIYSTTIIWTYLGFTVLYRIQETDYASVRPVGLGQYLVSSRHLKIYHPLAIIATFITTVLLISIAPVALYMYGYNKYLMSIMAVQQRNALRSHANNVNGAQSEYSEYHRRSSPKMPQTRLCCDGYAPHIFAIMLLLLTVIAKAPTIYAHMIIYQHEEKALLLSCIVIDITYLFSWIILWLILTLKRDWDFEVMHQLHEIIALQNGPQTMTTIPFQVTDKKPSELKNALIVMHRDQMYLSDETSVKQSILRQTQRAGHNGQNEGVYWLKGSSGQSPTSRKIPLNENLKSTPEMNRLLGNTTVCMQNNDENPSPTAAAYHTISCSAQSQCMHTPSQHGMIINGAKFPEDTSVADDVLSSGTKYTTLQRRQKDEYVSTLRRQTIPFLRRSSLQGSENANGLSPVHSAAVQPETYASIHKGSRVQPNISSNQRRGSKDDGTQNNGFSAQPSTYGSTYAGYRPQTRAIQNQQLMQQAAVQAAQAAQASRTMYGRFQAVGPEVSTPSALTSVKGSPIAENRLGLKSSVSSREPSPYQRAHLKLSSFNSATSGSDVQKVSGNQRNNPGCVYSSWTQQQLPSQSAQMADSSWSSSAACEKASSSATSTSHQEQCFTPTSTLTSQGSTSNYSSQQVPTPGSPNSHSNVYGGRFPIGASSLLYGTSGDDMPGTNSSSTPVDPDRTLKAQQKPVRSTVATGNTSVRHQIKVTCGSSRQDDSANFSLTSSNESTENTRYGSQTNQTVVSDYATSIV